jgi:hypothetical protein
MFAWLMRKFRRNSPHTIRTFEDLTAALKSGAIRPHVHQDGDQQVVDLSRTTTVIQRAGSSRLRICACSHRVNRKWRVGDG